MFKPIKILVYRDLTPPTTPEWVWSEAQKNECGQRVLESHEYHKTPHHVQLARSGVFTPAMPPILWLHMLLSTMFYLHI